jgi:hypothetical protein
MKPKGSRHHHKSLLPLDHIRLAQSGSHLHNIFFQYNFKLFPPMCNFLKWFEVSLKNFIHIPYILHACYMSCSSHPSHLNEEMITFVI